MPNISEKIPYRIFNNFIYRIPLFPRVELNKINYSTVFTSPIFNEAIFLASPDFYSEFQKSIKGELKPEEVFKIELSLLKYYLRSSNRCTPFGLFAGCGVGSIGEKDEIILSEFDKYKSFTRLDMNYLCNLITEISGIKHIQNQIKYFPNSSLYESGYHYRYAEYKYVKNQRKHFLVSLQKDPYLEQILQKVINGTSIDDLAKTLKSDDITLEDAKEYILEMINSQVLVSELAPCVTGKELLGQLIRKLEGLGQTNEIVNLLKEINTSIQSLDNLPIGRSINLYHSISDRLRDKFNIKIDRKFLFQSDLYIENEKATIDIKTVEMVLEGVSVLNKLSPRFENPYLQKFKEEFNKRYENEERSLVSVLDTETGIGFAEKNNLSGDINSLLDDIILFQQDTNNQHISLSPATAFIQKKYEYFISNPETRYIYIYEEELKSLPSQWNDLPNTPGIMIELIKEKSDITAIKLQSFGGSSAANLLGRFCHINKSIEELVKDITNKEKELDNEKIIAEVVHLPESRTGNILFRPTIRDFEIAYLANPSVDTENTININDIMVSVVNGKRIVLRSKKHNKEIIPRLSTAHNYSNNSLPIYHFLCSLQTQELKNNFGFNWGPLLDRKEYLPRVIYKNIIISPATWNILPSDLKKIPNINHENFFIEAENFRKEKKIPDKVLFVQGDNKLVIDFSHKMSVQLLFDKTIQRGFRLEEFLFTDNDEFVTRGLEHFTNQLILCFYKTNQTYE